MPQQQLATAPATPPPAPLPAFMRIKAWCQLSGMSAAGTYRALNSGSLKAIRMGNRTLIDCEHGLAFLRSLPAWRPTTDAETCH